MKISSDPQGARVFVNDEEVGVTPVKFAFTWYGDYDIILRKTGYQTVKTHYRTPAPWYQVPPIDLVAETLIPGTLRDVHELPTYALAPAEAPPAADVVARAVEMRSLTLFSAPGAAAPASQPASAAAESQSQPAETAPSNDAGPAGEAE
jgi:hypothetical protein